MLNKTRSIVIAIVIFSSFVLTACQSQAVPVTPQEEQETTLPPAGAGLVTVEVKVTRIVEKKVQATRIVEVTSTPTPIPTGGFLVATIGEDAAELNPLLAVDDSSRFISSFLYGGMLRPDPFTGELVCHFCTNWELTDRTYTFTLRDNMLWSDGEPVTADDFIYTYAALLWSVANETFDSPHRETAEAIESLVKIDEQTVAVTLKEENCALLDDFSLGWLPQHLYGPSWEYSEPVTLMGPFGDADDPNFATIENHEMNHAPVVSSGPFLFDEWVPGDHITLVRNPSYFKGAPYLDGLVVRVVPDKAEQVQWLRTGEVDLVERFPPRFLTGVELMGTLDVYKVLDDSYVYLGFQLGDPNNPQPRWLEDENTGQMVFNEAHGEHPILSDKRVRQAIAYSLDRYAIINQAELGQGVPLEANLLPSLTWAYNKDLQALGYAPETAAALLDQAGWLLNENTGLRQKDGQPLKLNLKTNLSSEKRIQIGEWIQEQLGGLGFDIEFEALEWGAFVGLLLGQQFDMVVISWTDLGNNPDDSLFFASENDVPGRGFNFVSHYNPTLDEQWRKAAALPGCIPAERGLIYRQIQTTLYDELPYIWLYAPLALTGANKRLVGINPGPWSTRYNVQAWYLAQH